MATGSLPLWPARILPDDAYRLIWERVRPAFLDSDPWRALRILSEFVDGFDALAGIGRAVTVFGSARVNPGQPEYELAREIGRQLAGDRGGGGILASQSRRLAVAGDRHCLDSG